MNIDRAGRVDLSDVRFVSPSKDERRLVPGDVLFNNTNSPALVGKTALVQKRGQELGFSNHMTRVRCSGAAEPAFVAHQLHSLFQAGYFRRQCKKHVNQASINPTFLREEVPLLLPPLNEQRRIVAKIEALMARSRRAKEALDAIPPLLERFRQSVLAAAFRGDLTADWRAKNPDVEPADQLLARIETPPRPPRYKSRSVAVIPGDSALSLGNPRTEPPRHWKWVPLVDVARLESGHTPSRRRAEWWGGDVPWVGLHDAGRHHGRVITQTRETTNEAGLANSAARLLPAGTVCLSRTGTIGYATVMGREMATSQDFANWVCTEAVEPHWLKLLFVHETRALHGFSAQTTNIATIYYPELISFHVCLPPIEEQREIVRRVESRIARATALGESVSLATGVLPELGRSVLAKAFRGELVPQDPNDEPASVLLERIKAERESNGAGTKTRAKRRGRRRR